MRCKVAQRAFTLVEVLVVIALMALLGGMIVSGSGMLSGTRLRAGATLIMSSVRAAITQANTTGRPVRLVFDFEHDRLLMEETHGPMLRVKSDTEGAKAGAEAATELEREAAEYARGFAEGPRAPAPGFSPVKEFERDAEPGAPGRELGRGIRFVQVQTEHDSEPRVEGTAYLYFWPGGGTEEASIQISRDGDLDGLTVLVNALTGRARLQRGRIDLEEARRDSMFEEREEE
jgi:general secretion pathway protein H